MNRVPLAIRGSAIQLLNQPFTKPISQLAYRGVARIAMGRLSTVGGVKSCFLRGGAVRHCVPGLSDIDIAIIVDDLNDMDYANLLIELRRVWASLRKHFVILGEVVVLDPQRLAILQRYRPALIESFSDTSQRRIPFQTPNEYASVCLAYEYLTRIASPRGYRRFDQYETAKYLRKAAGLLETQPKPETLIQSLIGRLQNAPPHFGLVDLRRRGPASSRSELPVFAFNPLFRARYPGLIGVCHVLERLQSLPESKRELEALRPWCSRALSETIVDQFVRLPTLLVNERRDSLNTQLRYFFASLCAWNARLLSNDLNLAVFYSLPTMPEVVRQYELTREVRDLTAHPIADLLAAAQIGTPLASFNGQ